MQFLKRHWCNFGIVFCTILMGVSCFAMLKSMNRVDHVFSAPSFEDNVVAGQPPSMVMGPDWSYVEDEALPFKIGIVNCPKSSNGRLLVWFTNPEDSDTWVQLQVMDADGNLTASSGLLIPGTYLESIPCDFSSGDEISVKIVGYEPNLYYSKGSFVLHTVVA